MMTGTALALAALLAGPTGAAPDEAEQASAARPEIAAPRPVPAEMIPAPGRWEVEDAPAYFSDRRAPQDEDAQDVRADAAGAGPVAATRRGAVVPLPRPRGPAALVAHRP